MLTMRMGIDMWITCEYDQDGEITNPEWVAAPDDSYWWVDDASMLHRVMMKMNVTRFPRRIALVKHPEEVGNE